MTRNFCPIFHSFYYCCLRLDTFARKVSNNTNKTFNPCLQINRTSSPMFETKLSNHTPQNNSLVDPEVIVCKMTVDDMAVQNIRAHGYFQMGIVWFLPFNRLIFVFVGPMQQALFGLCFPFFTIIRVGPRLHVTTTRMVCLIGMKFIKASVIFLYESAVFQNLVCNILQEVPWKRLKIYSSAKIRQGNFIF